MTVLQAAQELFVAQQRLNGHRLERVRWWKQNREPGAERLWHVLEAQAQAAVLVARIVLMAAGSRAANDGPTPSEAA